MRRPAPALSAVCKAPGATSDVFVAAGSRRQNSVRCPSPEAARAYVRQHVCPTPLQDAFDREEPRARDKQVPAVRNRSRGFAASGRFPAPCHHSRLRGRLAAPGALSDTRAGEPWLDPWTCSRLITASVERPDAASQLLQSVQSSSTNCEERRTSRALTWTYHEDPARSPRGIERAEEAMSGFFPVRRSSALPRRFGRNRPFRAGSTTPRERRAERLAA